MGKLTTGRSPSGEPPSDASPSPFVRASWLKGGGLELCEGARARRTEVGMGERGKSPPNEKLDEKFPLEQTPSKPTGATKCAFGQASNDSRALPEFQRDEQPR